MIHEMADNRIASRSKDRKVTKERGYHACTSGSSELRGRKNAQNQRSLSLKRGEESAVRLRGGQAVAIKKQRRLDDSQAHSPFGSICCGLRKGPVVVR
jgi:hypothetical protein